METDESIVVLYKGGRLSSWHSVSPHEQEAYQQEHVDLMLGIAHKYRLQHLEGFRLMAPQSTWERFWIIEFPTLAGAEAWIEAEMAPPYGRYGYYEYYLARSYRPEFCTDWVANAAPSVVVPEDVDPRQVPELRVDFGSVVVVLFERGEPTHGFGEKRLEDDYIEGMRSVTHQHGLMRLECFKLMAPQAIWHRVWLAEFPTVAGAEAYIDIEVSPDHGCVRERVFQLTRKWSPTYFATWVPR